MDQAFYAVTLIATALVLAAAFSSLIAFRFGAPLLLLFLAIGLASRHRRARHRVRQCRRAPISSARWHWRSSCSIPVSARRSARCRQAALPAVSLATIGVALTTTVFGAAAIYLTDFTWLESLPARRSRRIDRRRCGVLPAARRQQQSARPRPLDARNRVRHQRSDRDLPDHHAGRDDRARRRPGRRGADRSISSSASSSRWDSARQSALPADWPSCGSSSGSSSTSGLLPIFVLALSLLVFACAGAIGGSGFLAVYLAGLVAGNSKIRGMSILKRFQDGMSWLAQIIMFLVLGLFATPSQFPSILLGSVSARPVPDLHRPAAGGLALPASRSASRARRPPSSPGSACAVRCRSCSPSRRCSAGSTMAARSSTSPSSSCWCRWSCRAGRSAGWRAGSA